MNRGFYVNTCMDNSWSDCWIHRSKLVNKHGDGVVLDTVLGVIGAVVGGWLFSSVGMARVSGLNLYSLLVAVVDAVVVLFLYHAIIGRSRGINRL